MFIFQVEAAKKAKDDYKKAMKMIETAKAEAAKAASAAAAYIAPGTAGCVVWQSRPGSAVSLKYTRRWSVCVVTELTSVIVSS